jgi:hypothetical protein
VIIMIAVAARKVTVVVEPLVVVSLNALAGSLPLLLTTRLLWTLPMLQRNSCQKGVFTTSPARIVSTGLTANVKGEFARVADFTLPLTTPVTSDQGADTKLTVTLCLALSTGVRFGLAASTLSGSGQKSNPNLINPNLPLPNQEKPTAQEEVTQLD